MRNRLRPYESGDCSLRKSLRLSHPSASSLPGSRASRFKTSPGKKGSVKTFSAASGDLSSKPSPAISHWTPEFVYSDRTRAEEKENTPASKAQKIGEMSPWTKSG